MTSSELADFIGASRLKRRLAYLAVRITTLREWYLTTALRRIIGSRKQFRFLDAGCGLGQHAVRIARQHPGASVLALDVEHALIANNRDYAIKNGLHNLEFRVVALDEQVPEGPFDVILCSSVLEHIENDELVMSGFHRSLVTGGILLVYVPVSERRVFKSLDRKIKNMTRQDNAELPHGHVRYYTPAELLKKLERAGFCIVSSRNTYGPLGRWSYDMVTTVQYSRYVKLLFPLYMLFLHPFVMLLMWLDTRMQIKEGNGLMIIAEKKV